MRPGGQLRRTPMPQRTGSLRPSGQLQRKTGLKSSGSLQRGKGLARHAALDRSTKPLPPVNAARQARKTEAAGMPKSTAQRRVRKRSSGWCELRISSVCLGRATNFAHIKPEGQGGLYVPSGLLHLCGMGNVSGCHGYQEKHRIEARGKGWLVLSNTDHRKRPVWMWYRGVWGEWVLDDKGSAVPVTGEAS